MPALEALLPLPQPGRQHAEGTGAALEAGGALDGFKKAQAHTALADIHESIDELLHYRSTFLPCSLTPARRLRVATPVARRPRVAAPWPSDLQVNPDRLQWRPAASSWRRFRSSPLTLSASAVDALFRLAAMPSPDTGATALCS